MGMIFSVAGKLEIISPLLSSGSIAIGLASFALKLIRTGKVALGNYFDGFQHLATVSVLTISMTVSMAEIQ